MKIEITENKYPWIGIGSNDVVVLFSSHKTGVVLSAREGHFCGEYSTSWNMDFFKPFTGKIMLSND